MSGLKKAIGHQREDYAPNGVSEHSAKFLLSPYRSTEIFDSGDNEKNIQYADNIVSWQMDNGSWSKDNELNYLNPYVSGPKSIVRNKISGIYYDLGVLDNNATVNEIRFLANVFSITGKETYRESINRGLGFILGAQYPSGGFPQVWPRRTGSTVQYSNNVTTNDDVMMKIILLLDDIENNVFPFNSGLVDSELLESISLARSAAVDFLLKAQIKQNGVRTGWCQQHHPLTYAPVGGRAYELPARCGNESVAIAMYLILKGRTEEEYEAGIDALRWLNKVRVDGMRYVQYTEQPYVQDDGFVMHYRFYDLDRDVPFFCGRDGIKKYDIQEIESERRLSYQWGGYFAQKMLTFANALELIEDQEPMPNPAPRLTQYSTPWDMTKNRIIGHFGVPTNHQNRIISKEYSIDGGPVLKYEGHFEVDIANTTSVTLTTKFSHGVEISRTYVLKKDIGFTKLNYSGENPV